MVIVQERGIEDKRALRRSPRYGELSLGGFVAVNERDLSHEGSLRGWLTVFGMDAYWQRRYDLETPSSRKRDTFRFSLVRAFIAQANLEVHLLVGADLRLARAESTRGALGLGAEVRSYPWHHWNLGAAMRVSIFALENPLFDVRVEAGPTLGRLDLRAGVRGFFQDGSRGLFGPSMSILIRLGP